MIVTGLKTRMGYRVRVGFIRPSPYPQRGLAVYLVNPELESVATVCVRSCAAAKSAI